MKAHRIRWAALLGLLGILVVAIPQLALADDDADPPSRVARLSFTSGSVSFSPAGTDDWVDAVLNRPVTIGDKLWTDKDSRAELGMGTAYIRMDSNTGFSFLNLDDQTTQIRVTEGTISVTVRRLEDNEVFEVDTPNLAFSVLKPGRYTINVNENGDATIVDVSDGQGEVTGGGSAYTIHAGESGTFSGTDQLSADFGDAQSNGDFDTWCADRDERNARSVSARYVSDDVVGYEDLDEYGGWRTDPDYGTVWFPHTTTVGWAPYRYGHWVWISPWGWTWVDDAPWGFAPFHYGRWVTVRGVWGWVPAPPRPRVVTAVYVRPVYSPALVAWVGGPNFGVGVAVGGVGAGVAWFPLGPRDVYCPSYHVSQRYVERVNVSNTVIINRTTVTNVYTNVYVNKNVTNIRYQNQGINGSVTAVSRTTFTSAQPVGRNVVRVNQREVVSARVAPMSPGLAPQQRSVLGAGAQARYQPPARLASRQVVVKNAPPPRVASFNQQQRAIESNGGRPISVNQERALNPNETQARTNYRVAPAARPVAVDPRNNGGNRGAQSRAVQGQPPANNNRAVVNPQTQQNQQQGNYNGNRGNRNYGDRPQNMRPNNNVQQVNPQIQQKQEQQMEQLREKQDAERQKVEQQQIQQRDKLNQANATQQKQQQMQNRQQQQLEKMEQKHDQQARSLEMKQQRQREVQKPHNEAKPPKNDNNNNKPHQ